MSSPDLRRKCRLHRPTVTSKPINGVIATGVQAGIGTSDGEIIAISRDLTIRGHVRFECKTRSTSTDLRRDHHPSAGPPRARPPSGTDRREPSNYTTHYRGENRRQDWRQSAIPVSRPLPKRSGTRRQAPRVRRRHAGAHPRPLVDPSPFTWPPFLQVDRTRRSHSSRHPTGRQNFNSCRDRLRSNASVAPPMMLCKSTEMIRAGIHTFGTSGQFHTQQGSTHESNVVRFHLVYSECVFFRGNDRRIPVPFGQRMSQSSAEFLHLGVGKTHAHRSDPVFSRAVWN